MYIRLLQYWPSNKRGPIYFYRFGDTSQYNGNIKKAEPKLSDVP